MLSFFVLELLSSLRQAGESSDQRRGYITEVRVSARVGIRLRRKEGLGPCQVHSPRDLLDQRGGHTWGQEKGQGWAHVQSWSSS